MALKVSITEPFTHRHETRMFEDLADSLAPYLRDNGDSHLIGNVMCNGRELDGVLLKQNAICVIELKAYSGQIQFSENQQWWADDQIIQGGNQQNPFRQVRYNKFGLLDFLNRHTEGKIKPQNWGRISGAVIFQSPIVFDEGHIPGNISPWFHVTDLADAGQRLSAINSPGISLTEPDLALLSTFFGANDHSTPAARPLTLRVHYHKESGFRQALQELRSSGGPAQIAANIFVSFADQLRNGRDPFAQSPTSTRPEISNLNLYTIGQGYQLAAVRNNNVIHLCTIGNTETVESWIQANKGLTFTMDAEGRITPSFVGNPRDHVPSNLTSDRTPFLNQIEGLSLSDYGLPVLVESLLLEVDAETPEEKRLQILEIVPEPELRSCIADVFGLVRTGDITAAQARVNLFNGVAIQEEDQVGEQKPQLDPGANSETLVDLVGLSKEDWEKLLDPSRFQDWMLFLHPDQKAIVEEDFEKPGILTGVSGSGKTCVLVHRAKRLAGLYPGDKIGILTLNRSLAKLIDNLVGELCPRDIRARIEVLAFYDYFQKLVEHFGPNEEMDSLRVLALKYLDNEHMSRVLKKIDPDRYKQKLQQRKDRPKKDQWQQEQTHLLKAIKRVDPERYARLFDPQSGETLEDTWHLFLEQKHVQELLQLFGEHLYKYDGFVSPSAYLREEFSLIRSAAATATRHQGLPGASTARTRDSLQRAN